MSSHNICFRGEIRKIFTRYPPLSRPMDGGHLMFFVICFFFSFLKNMPSFFFVCFFFVLLKLRFQNFGKNYMRVIDGA